MSINVADEADLQRTLEEVVTTASVWRVIESLDQRLRGVGPRTHSPELMGVIVLEVARACLGTLTCAAQELSDLRLWSALRAACAAAFANHPARRLSPTPPNRFQHYRLRRRLSDDVFAELGRAVQREMVFAATRCGLFDPARRIWPHPDASQSAIADMTWSSVHVRGRRHPAEARRGTVPGRPLVVLSVRGDTVDRIALNAETTPQRGMGRAVPDQVIKMFRHPPNQGGAAPHRNDDKVAWGRIGVHPFTDKNGTTHNLEVRAVDGAPVVDVTDPHGTPRLVALRRRRAMLAANAKQRVVARCRYEIPHSPAVPVHLRGATTVIRLTTTETQPSADIARTLRLRRLDETGAGIVE